MEIKIVPITTGRIGTKSKYLSYFTERFTDDDIENLKQALSQIKNNPTLGVMIDISDIKEFSGRHNKISERGQITEDGQTKTYGTIARAFATFLNLHGIRGVYFVIRERDDKVYVTIKDLSSQKATPEIITHASSE